MNVALPILIITVLILLNGLFVAAEFAIVGSRKARVDRLVNEGQSGAKAIQKTLASARSQDRYIATAQLGITLATIGLGMYGEPSIARWIYGPLERSLGVSEAFSHTLGTIIAVAVMTYFHVVIGEMIPKAMALQAPETVAQRIAWMMRSVGLLLAPLVWLLNSVGNLCLRLLGVPIAGHGRYYSPSELEQLVDESHEGGAVADRQHELIDNIFSFGQRVAAQLMTPRTRVVGLELSSSSETVMEVIKEGYSRLPVYKGDLDRIVGILHVKDFIKAYASGQSLELSKLMRRAPRVPEQFAAESLLAAFKRLKVHMAVVMNEYGGTSGVVTLEDLLEEVVGELQDEFDDAETELVELEPGKLLAPGELIIAELNDDYDLSLSTERAETLGGLVVDALGRAPAEGDEVVLEGVGFRVEKVEGLAIRELLVVLPSAEPSPSALPDA